MTGQVVTGLSLVLVLALREGVKPESKGAAGRPMGRDWGNLLLASVVFWSYLAFAQFLIIWAGNLPEEISWFLRRERGQWELVAPGVALFGFALPFLLLLSRRVKSSATGLAWTAAMLLAAQLAYAAWVIIPAEAPISLRGSAAIAAVLAALVALFLSCFAQRARHWRQAGP
jgi:amino acid permease